ncbi:MAG: histidine phosphatase family protein [Caldilineae bacterium]|nr:MAG: histidine phosphatase family protein [Caldilineae bacterium]
MAGPKILQIMRHAKSSHDPRYPTDFERPLNPRGQRDARRMGEWLARRGLLPDLIVSSPAVRARETAERLIEASGYAGELVFDGRIYGTSVGDPLLEVIAQCPDGAGTVMLVGHNPALEDLVSTLLGGEVRLATATIACLELLDETWSEVGAESGSQLLWLIRPKLLP